MVAHAYIGVGISKWRFCLGFQWGLDINLGHPNLVCMYIDGVSIGNGFKYQFLALLVAMYMSNKESITTYIFLQ